jgi:hypothetical protein
MAKAKRSFRNVKFAGMNLHDKAFPANKELGYPGMPVTCFIDDKGRDWYDEREDNKWGAVVATWPDGHIGAFEKDAMNFIPVEGYTVWEIDPADIPETDKMKLFGFYSYDGKVFTRIAD